MKSIGVPLGFVLQPICEPKEDEEQVPISLPSDKGPFRCGRCNAYINPFFRFEGYTGICNICKFPNQIPENFQATSEHPELNKPVYDLIAPMPQYKNRDITNIHLLFVIELSASTITLGIPQQVLASLMAIIETIPCPEQTEIGFITFESTHLTYYKCKDSTRDVQELLVAELDEDCVPLSHAEMFMNLSTETTNIQLVLEKLNKKIETFSLEKGSSKLGIPLGAAINNAISSLKSKLGRALVFTAHPPTIGFGKFKKREEASLAGTDKEKSLFAPQIDLFSKLGKECSSHGISVDLFAFNVEGFDLATLSETTRISGGNLFYFPSYIASQHSEKLHFDLARNLTRGYAFDCIMTMRSSQGLVLSEYHTSRGKVLVRDLEMGSISSDQSIAVILQQEEKIAEVESYVQFALLHTNIFGQRLIRVINLAIQIDNSIRS